MYDNNNYSYLRNNRKRESVFKPKYFVDVKIFNVRCNLHIFHLRRNRLYVS